MKKVCYYVYSEGVLGVKTNIQKFRWIYGTVAPSVSSEEYEKCIVKFDVCVQPEAQLEKVFHADKRFQSYLWDAGKKTIAFRRKFGRRFEVGYNIKIDKNTIVVTIGQNYYTFIQNRVMNLHGMYYVLSDLANVILLKNGFLTLYASAIYCEPSKRGIVNFAPPNTGKTYTALNLCEASKNALVGEDIVLWDGHNLHACVWTNSYRNGNKRTLSNLLRKANKLENISLCEECEVTDLTVLSLGEKEIHTDKELILQQITLLNGYLFNYYSTPIVKILGYFDEEYNQSWNRCAEEMLYRLICNSKCYSLQTRESTQFAKLIQKIILGENT